MLLCGAFALVTSCKKDAISPGSEGDNVKPANDKITNSAGDGKWDLLGYGYDLTGDYANSNSGKFSIINIERLKLENPTAVESSGAETSTTTFEVGENATDFARKITNKTTLTGGVDMLFKGSIDYNFSNENKWSSKYIYGLYSQKIIKKRVYLMNNLTLLKNYLQPQFINDVNTLTPAELVNMYGTHILSDIRLGGKMEVIYQAETNSSTRILAASAGVETSFTKIFGVKTSGTYDETLVKSNYNQTLTARTIGGASEQTISGLTIGADGRPSATINVSGWSSGVTDANAELIEINSVIPIYDLISDPAKKSAVQNYITQYFIARQISLTPDLVYIFENAARKDYALSTNINTPQVYPGWAYSDVVFKAYTYNPSVAQPIYSYINNVNGDHAYTTTKITLADWVAEGIPFYAYSSQVPGTVPVYQFYNSANTSHYYSTNRNATNGYAGWAFEGVCFYAFPIN